MKVKIALFSFFFGITKVLSQDVEQVHCTDEARNGNFDNNATFIELWENAPTKYGSVEMSLVPGVEGNAMKVTNRYAWWASPTLDIDKGCFAEGDTLEYSVRIKLIDDNGMPLSCRPGQVWGKGGIIEGVCPLMTLKTRLDAMGSDFDTAYIDVAAVIAPFVENDWNTMHGVYTVTKEFLAAEKISLMFYKMEKKIGYIVDNLSIKKVEDGCANLIINGDAEAGDARGWQYTGDITTLLGVEQTEFTLGSYHFVNSNRLSFDDGAMTFLDNGCFDTESIYKISGKVKLSEAGTLVPCDYLGTSTTGGDIPRCPMIHLGAGNTGGPRQFRPIAAVNKPFSTELNEWNELSSLFSFFPIELQAEDLFLFISGSPGGVDIHMDDLVLERVASAKPVVSETNSTNDLDSTNTTESSVTNSTNDLDPTNTTETNSTSVRDSKN